MEEPARKRRRTISPAQDERHSSPLKQPPRRPSFASHTAAGADRPQSPLKQPPRRPSVSPTKARHDRSSSPLKKNPRRPSFASPTKASLARNYPNLLRQPSPSSTAGQNGHGHTIGNGREAHAYIMESRDKRTWPEQEARSDAKSRMANGTAQASHAAGPQNAKPRAREVEQGESEDSDLPLTPSRKDVPRRGILFSTPTKKPQKLKAAAQESSILSTSPLNQEPNLDKSEENKEQEHENQKNKQPPDPELEHKRKEKKKLMQELEELENQVSRCTEEIARIKGQPPPHNLPPKEREDLISLVNQISKNNSEAIEDRAPSISSLLCSFLPFSAQTIPPPKSKQSQLKPVPSHKPLDLEDPLPYLQMFTNFTIETQLDLANKKVPSAADAIHQKHTIQMTGPQKLLTASLSLIIDVPSHTITNLQIQTLSPWAERELGSFIREKALQNDLSNACWAIGSYWDLARKRAEYWHKCETAFAHLLPSRTIDDTENIANQRRNQRPEAAKTITRRDLNRHLGRDVLVLQNHHVLLQVKWEIGFDWTGDAESEVGVRAAVPRVWTEADTSKSFDKIPETFDMLLQTKGAFTATKIMVALLFAED